MQAVGQPAQGITAKPWPAWLPTQDLSTAYGYPLAAPPTRPGTPGSPCRNRGGDFSTLSTMDGPKNKNLIDEKLQCNANNPARDNTGPGPVISRGLGPVISRAPVRDITDHRPVIVISRARGP